MQNITMNITKQHKKKPQNKKNHAPADDGNKKGNLYDPNDSGHGDSSETASATLVYVSPLEIMTSKEFQYDVNAHIGNIHQKLKDSVLVKNLKEAIMHNQHLFRDKQVLNLGCGVGIFSLFAAKAGAAKVYAIDTSNVVYYTRKIVAANGYENVINVLQGKIEDIELPVKEVDIIISDWMGYALLYNSTCDDVIYARDKWLKKPGGMIFPDKGQLYMVALQDREHKNGNIEWWRGVYGFNMKCLRDIALKEPRYHTIGPEQLLCQQCPIYSLDLNTAKSNDLKFRNKYMLRMQKAGHLDAIAFYFHIYFSKTHTPMGFSTDPWSAGTNWMQTVFYLDQSLPVRENAIYYGGIEMFSPKTTIDLNDMIVNMEMLMGDLEQPDVDIEMTWFLKPATAATQANDNNKKSAENSDEKTEAKNANAVPVNKASPDFNLTFINNKMKSCNIEQRLNDLAFSESMNKIQVPTVMPVYAVQSSEGAKENAKTENAIIIGNTLYHCRKTKRPKNKHKQAKKG